MLIWLLLAAFAGQAPSLSPQPTQARPAPPLKIYSETADAKAQIASAIHAAATDDIRVLIKWCTNEDERCARFEQVLGSIEVVRTRYASDEYKIVNVHAGSNESTLQLAREYGVKVASGVLPLLTVLDATGKVVTQAAGSEFAEQAGSAAFDAAKVAAFLTRNQAPPPPAAAPVFEAAVERAKREGKYVFVWFSAPW